MTTTFTDRFLPARAARCKKLAHLLRISIVAVSVLMCGQLLSAQTASEFQQTLTVAPTEPVALDIDLLNGDLEVAYGRDGQVSIAASAKAPSGVRVDGTSAPAFPSVEQSGNRIIVRQVPNSNYPQKRSNTVYRIDVPYRTTLTSKLEVGKQSIEGLFGPVKAQTNSGDIRAAYISQGLEARVGTGNLDLQVIGGHVNATVGKGNISCERLPQGVNAETGDGDIKLTVVGSSTAIVKTGTGRVEVGGARGSLEASTDAGGLHVKAIPHQDWQLSSASGDVRVELPHSAKFEFVASTNTGELRFDRDDITKPDSNSLQFRQAINGGGDRIKVHTESGRITIQ
jgi:hypothetical protein